MQRERRPAVNFEREAGGAVDDPPHGAREAAIEGVDDALDAVELARAALHLEPAPPFVKPALPHVRRGLDEPDQRYSSSSWTGTASASTHSEVYDAPAACTRTEISEPGGIPRAVSWRLPGRRSSVAGRSKVLCPSWVIA
jgi:hypothetical protein